MQGMVRQRNSKQGKSKAETRPGKTAPSNARRVTARRVKVKQDDTNQAVRCKGRRGQAGQSKGRQIMIKQRGMKSQAIGEYALLRVIPKTHTTML